MVFINPSDNSQQIYEGMLRKPENNIHSKLQSDPNYKSYIALNDSIERLIRFEKDKLKGSGSTNYLLTIGLKEIVECDTCNNLSPLSISENISKYFLQFEGFTISPNTSFFIKNGKYYLEKFVKEKETEISQTGYMDTIETKIRLSVNQFREEKIFLLVPITKQLYSVLNICIQILILLMIFIGLRIFIFMPFQLLMNIAYGNPFLKINIRYLKTIGWTTLGVTIFVLMIPFIVKLLLPGLIPKEIYYPFLVNLFKYKLGLFIGVAILLIANAFESGYNLQQEQDLTV